MSTYTNLTSDSIDPEMKAYIRKLAYDENKTYDEIAAMTNLGAKELYVILDDIEDDKLVEVAEERFKECGSWEEMFKRSIPAEQVYASLGITQEDIDNAESDGEFE
jgi:hypothetical protein